MKRSYWHKPKNLVGYIYLLHFDEPISERHTTQHYLGWAEQLGPRIDLHLKGRGAVLTAVARERGIGFRVVRVWRGSRCDERWLKDRKNAPRLCPCCAKKPQEVAKLEDVPEAAYLPML